MPYIAPRSYHEFPDLHVVLDFLGGCEREGQQMVARYPDSPALHAAETACRQLGIQPLPDRSVAGNRDQGRRLCISSSDWRALSKNVLPMLAGQLRLLFKAVDDATALEPLQWDALPLPDRALAAWGTAAGMVALRLQPALSYLACRYPVYAPQRRKLRPIGDAGHASSYRTRHALGFQVAVEDGTQYLACHGDDWRNELALSTALLKHHLTLVMRIGLQLVAAGDTDPLPDMCWTIAQAGKTPVAEKLHALLQTYQEYAAANAPGPDPRRTELLRQCLAGYIQWQHDGRLLAGDAQRTALQPYVAGRGMKPRLQGIADRSGPGAPFTDPDTSSPFHAPAAFGQTSPDRHAPGRHAPKRKRDVEDLSGGDVKRLRIGGNLPDEVPATRNMPTGVPAMPAPTIVPVHIVFLADRTMFQHPGPDLSRVAISAITHRTDNIETGPGAVDEMIFPLRQRAVTVQADLHEEAANRPAASRPFAAFRLSMPGRTVDRNEPRRASENLQIPEPSSEDSTHDPAPATLQPFPVGLFQGRGPWF